MIGNRQSDILGLIINHYIQTGEPMGSKTLALSCLIPYPRLLSEMKWRLSVSLAF